MLSKNQLVFISFCTILFGTSFANESNKTTSDLKEIKNNKNTSNSTVDQEIAFDFKGIKLGQNFSDVKKKFKGIRNHKNNLVCQDDNASYMCESVSNLSILNRPISKAIFAQSNKNKVQAIYLEFNEKYYDEVKEALIKKFGTGYIEQTPLSNEITGKSSVLEQILWLRKDSNAVLSNHNKDGSSYQAIGTLYISATSTSKKEEPADL